MSLPADNANSWASRLLAMGADDAAETNAWTCLALGAVDLFREGLRRLPVSENERLVNGNQKAGAPFDSFAFQAPQQRKRPD